MELMYPIKYVSMPLYEISYTGEREGIHAYVTVECYLISEIKIYLASGKTINKYEIVYKRNCKDAYDRNEYEPLISFDGECYNSIYEHNIFDTKEEADNRTCILNRKLVANKAAYYPIDEAIEKLDKFGKEVIDYTKIFLKKDKVKTKS